MQLGQLFFALAVKGQGDIQMQKFDDAVTGAHESVLQIQDSISHFIFLLERMAVKMGAVTQEEIEMAKQRKTGAKEVEKESVVETKQTKGRERAVMVLHNLREKTKSYGQNLALARTQLIAATGALTAFVKKSSDVAVQLDKINALTGVSTQTMQKLGAMAAQTGGSVDDIAGAVRHFQEEAVNISLGRGGNVGVWQFMGIDPRQDPLMIIGQLQAKLKSMPTALGTVMAKDLGLSDDLIYFLKNADALEPPSEETILSDAEVKRLKAFNFEFNRVWDQTKRILTKLGAFIAPLASQIVYAADRMSRAIGSIIKKVEPFFETLKQMAPALAMIFGIIAAKMFPITAALSLLALVLEDLWTFFEGGDSVLGRWVAAFKEIGSWVEFIKVGIAAVLDTLTMGKFTEKIGDMVFDPKKFLGDIGSNIKGWFSGDAAPTMPATGAASGATNNVKIEINGAKDSKVVGNEVLEKLKKATGDSFFQQPQGGY